jgi:hypothetical protein
LVGSKNEELSKNYAKQLYTREYLRGARVTGRIGDIQVNTDGSKTIIRVFFIERLNRFLSNFIVTN